MPRGVLGMNASMFKGYLRYIANRRATQIGLEALFPNEENPFPWMSEMIDLKKERNFFETRVIEYQSGGALSWDRSHRALSGDGRLHHTPHTHTTLPWFARWCSRIHGDGATAASITMDRFLSTVDGSALCSLTQGEHDGNCEKTGRH